MKCSIEGCPGEYELKHVLHTVRSGEDVVVIDRVPAEVCSVCGDVLFDPETVRHIEHLTANHPNPVREVPLVDFQSV